ncbi:MAG: cell division protein FtsL [Rhodocyclaceae bacterium]|jgi:cell division protein FtsL|nr:cell division protein FtsL [Rhodocyclaceae bacterium]
MYRVESTLVVLVVASALGTVAAQHQARQRFIALEREQARMQQLEVEWGQLQLEQSTWASHARVEKIARDKLGMRTPVPGQLVVAEDGR